MSDEKICFLIKYIMSLTDLNSLAKKLPIVFDKIFVSKWRPEGDRVPKCCES
jgi:hypothetical protein